MIPRFTAPTLVTLTAPTCAGKNFLLEELVSQFGFGRIVSTTDRPPRDGEIDGLHYFFISTEQSKEMEAEDEFAELVTYNGVRYGVTHEEMALKMHDYRPPMVILEPSGLEIYREYCAKNGWQLFSIFVSTPESIRLERLAGRTTADIVQRMNRGSSRVMGSDEAQVELAKDLNKIVTRNNARLKAIVEEERGWQSKANWDAIVDGTNVGKALETVALGVRNRNQRQDIYA